MRLASAIMSAFLAVSALAAPSAFDLSEIASVREAQAKGVDVFGEIPSDAVKIGNGTYTAEEGTLANLWMRARIDIPPQAWPDNDKIDKRGLSGFASIGIGMWAQDWCTGQGKWIDDVQYDVPYTSDAPMFSVGISYRSLRENEQLDFSRLYGGSDCGKYLYSAGRRTPVGCFESQLITCFRLLIH